MDTYTKYAKAAPAIIVMVIPSILVCILFLSCVQDIIFFSKTIVKICSFLPISLIVCSLGFFCREFYRMISKIVFQYIFFKNDETEMPTTIWLLHSDKTISEQEKKQLREKVKKDFDIELPSKGKEKRNLVEAKKEIAYAVRQMREVTRGNKILLQYNYQYGFFRNAIGGFVVTNLFILFIIILNHYMHWSNPCWGWGALVFQLILLLIFIIFAFLTADNYARHLFTVYKSTTV